MPERSIFGWLVIGLVAGLLARLLRPGRDAGGLAVPVLIGIAGALLGGFLLVAAGVEPAAHWPGNVAATVGAIVLLLLFRLTIARRLR